MFKSPFFTSDAPDPDRRRIRFVGFTLVLVVVWNFTSSLLGAGWIAASVITGIILLLYAGYAWRYRDVLLCRCLAFGLAAGWVELLADCWLVQNTGTLVYIKGGPFVMCSPLYMPFAWANVLTYFSCLSYWCLKQWGVTLTSLIVALLGAVNIPLYEHWAKGADWWFYQHTPMLGHTPIYIIMGEFLIVLALPLMLCWVEKSPWSWIIVLGSLQGLWIWVGYALAFQLTG